MRERKCVKLKVNMYEDTKFKIIDMKPERDLIHYIWTSLITLAGKVNLEGRLYMSKNIPYTIETLAIEFNRDAHQIKLALDVFVELEMIQITAENVYIVKNFVKHQNIKVKEVIKSKDEEEDVKIKEVEMDNLETTHKDINKIENIDISKIGNKHSNNTSNTICDEQNKSRHKIEITNRDARKNKDTDISKNGNKDSENINNAICDEKINNKLQDNMPIVLEEKRNKGRKNKKKKTISCDDIEEQNKDDKMLEFCDVDEENGDNEMFEFFEGEEGRTLMQGECVVEGWCF